MDAQEWIARCSARLRGQWSRLHQDMRDRLAADLWSDERWRRMEPELAVAEWLHQSVAVRERSDET